MLGTRFSVFITQHSLLSTQHCHLMTAVRSRQHIRRYCDTDLFSGFQIDDELKLRRLLDGNIGGLRAFQEFCLRK